MVVDKKTSEQLFDELDGLKDGLDGLKTEVADLKTITKDKKILPIEKTEKETVSETALEHIKRCKNCRDVVEKEIAPEILKKYAESLKDHKIVKCASCGLPVAEDWEKCPNCGGTKADRLN